MTGLKIGYCMFKKWEELDVFVRKRKKSNIINIEFHDHMPIGWTVYYWHE
jgi:hypothetical protein